MKKIILLALFLGISSVLWTVAMAKREPGDLGPPSWVKANVVSNSICFEWETIGGATKYALNIFVQVDGDSADGVAEFSFGTGERTDGRNPSDPDLCIPLSDFVSDFDEDGVPDPVYGTAIVKVKALDPGKEGRRQNNSFSDPVECSLTDQNAPPDPVINPGTWDPLGPGPVYP